MDAESPSPAEKPREQPGEQNDPFLHPQPTDGGNSKSIGSARSYAY